MNWVAFAFVLLAVALIACALGGLSLLNLRSTVAARRRILRRQAHLDYQGARGTQHKRMLLARRSQLKEQHSQLAAQLEQQRSSLTQLGIQIGIASQRSPQAAGNLTQLAAEADQARQKAATLEANVKKAAQEIGRLDQALARLGTVSEADYLNALTHAKGDDPRLERYETGLFPAWEPEPEWVKDFIESRLGRGERAGFIDWQDSPSLSRTRKRPGSCF